MIDISKVNSKLKTERRAKQGVTRGQVECAKLSLKVSRLTAKIEQLATDLKEEKAASAKLAPVKPSSVQTAAKKIVIRTAEESARLEKLYLAKEENKKAETNLVRK